MRRHHSARELDKGHTPSVAERVLYSSTSPHIRDSGGYRRQSSRYKTMTGLGHMASNVATQDNAGQIKLVRRQTKEVS